MGGGANMKTGKVLFVGAGPGDPKLITVRGLEALQQADVVVYDRLANPRLLTFVKKDARFVYCGKESNKHVIPQEEINRILVQEARAGNLVVRLKGGDPSIFGRVGEEAEACRNHDVPFDIVPGITSGIAAPLHAGIPLTHRDYNSSVAFLTGHLCEKNQAAPIRWEQFTGVDTLVIYMGVKNLPHIREQLLRHGKSPTTPVALVRWGTLAEQQTLVGELDTIVDMARAAQFAAPAIIVVGEVVRLRDRLNWYEQKPLFGKSVAYAAHPLADATCMRILEEQGADVFPLPIIAEPVQPDWFRDVTQFDVIEFGDRLQVTFFFQALRKAGIDLRQVQAAFIARWPDVAEELEARGLRPAAVLNGNDVELGITRDHSLQAGTRILVLQDRERSSVSSEVAATQPGVIRKTTSLYRLCLDRSHPAVAQLLHHRFDWLVTADPLVLQALREQNADWLARKLVCIGRETAERAQACGWDSFLPNPDATECGSPSDPIAQKDGQVYCPGA